MKNLNNRPHMSLDDGEELGFDHHQVGDTVLISVAGENGIIALTFGGKPNDLLSLFHNLIDQVHQSDNEDREMMLMPK